MWVWFCSGDNKNVGKEFLKVAEVGAIKKVSFKITYPKDALWKKIKNMKK